MGAATTKRFAQLLTLAQSAGGIILHLSVHVEGSAFNNGPFRCDEKGAAYKLSGSHQVSEFHVAFPSNLQIFNHLCAYVTYVHSNKVVNAETNVGIVFENDFGGAHILYRQELEELLGGQRPGKNGLKNLKMIFRLNMILYNIPIQCIFAYLYLYRLLDKDYALFSVDCHGGLHQGSWRAYPSCLSMDAPPPPGGVGRRHAVEQFDRVSPPRWLTSGKLCSTSSRSRMQLGHCHTRLGH